MLARGGMQGLDTRLDFAQEVGIEVDARSVMAQLAHRLADLRFGGFEELHHHFQSLIVLRERAQLRGDGAQLRERGAFGLGERLER